MILGRPPGPRTGPYVALDRVADDDIGIGPQYLAELEPKSQNHHVHFDISAEDISTPVSLVRAPRQESCRDGSGAIPPEMLEAVRERADDEDGSVSNWSAGLSKRS